MSATNTPNVPDELQLLAFLDHLKEHDPELYKQTIESMQAQLAQAQLGQTQGSSDLPDILSSLKPSGSGLAAGVEGSLNMPGMTKVLGKDGVEDKKPGITITPSPGFVIKTKRMADGSKLMINLCVHDELEIPSLKKKLDENGEPVEGMNIPLSVGPARTSTDKAGISCTVHDIIVNPQVVRESQEDATGRYRDFVCQLAIQAVESKYKVELDKRYKLPKLKYIGDVVDQYIQNRKLAPKIEEVSAKSTTEAPATAASIRKMQTGKDTKASSVTPVVAADIALTYTLRWETFAKSGGETITKVSESGHPDPDLITAEQNEYIEPMTEVPAGKDAIQFIAEIHDSVDCKAIQLQLSAYKLKLKIPGYQSISVSYPCVVLPGTLRSKLFRPPGYVRMVVLRITVGVDTRPLNDCTGPDPGSKQWLLSKALQFDSSASAGANSESFAGNPYLDDVVALSSERQNGTSVSSGTNGGENKDQDEIFPEDKFHIRLPAGVDQYTGVPLDPVPAPSNSSQAIDMSEELPEERFHKKDAQSTYIIEQREQAVKDKIAKADKEREERKNDPNVEYISVDDYKPGGKYGPPIAEPKAIVGDALGNDSEVRKSAAAVVSSMVTQNFSHGLDLSSNLWTELLD